MYLKPEIYNLTASVLKIDINYRKFENISMEQLQNRVRFIIKNN